MSDIQCFAVTIFTTNPGERREMLTWASTRAMAIAKALRRKGLREDETITMAHARPYVGTFPTRWTGANG
jgi:hypothetical protein